MDSKRDGQNNLICSKKLICSESGERNELFIWQVSHKKKIFIGSSLVFLNRERNIDKNYFDYIRLATLELVSYEIAKKNLAGNVAELGVYKGKFARYLNQYFPDRLLYLFDTFEGFDNRDIEREKAKTFFFR